VIVESFLDLEGVISADIKIIFTGSVGSGKSQAISVVSDIEVVKTDVRATDEVRAKKDKTTVAMDYGELKLDEETTLALYGTPGQERFRFMWDILSRGAIGIVIMVDNSRKDPISDLDIYLENFREHINASTAVVGVTHTDISPEPAMEKYYEHMQKNNLFYPIYPVDARNKDDINLILQSLVAMLEVG
jgi:signal recognition particle receptor subunit beta